PRGAPGRPVASPRRPPPARAARGTGRRSRDVVPAPRAGRRSAAPPQMRGSCRRRDRPRVRMMPEPAGRVLDLRPTVADSLPSNDGAVVQALYQRGRAAHPDIAMDRASFARHLAACGAPVGDPDAAAALHAEDLYLCAAALLGDAAAATALRRLHRPVVARYLR